MTAQQPLRAIVNIPFCARRCTYCDFPIYDRSTSGMRSAYMDALTRELHNASECFEGHTLEAVYITGGTPTTVNPQELSSFIKELKMSCEISPGLEITIDTNPGAIGVDALAQYKSAGVDRFEIGLCTAHPLEFETLIRPYGQNDIHFTQMLFEFGEVANYSFDILYGIPGQTPHTFVDSIEAGICMSPAPSHISLYPLRPIKGTPFYRCFVEEDKSTRIQTNGRSLPDNEAKRDMYLHGCEYLKQHGFERYATNHFAKPGRRSRFHEMSCQDTDIVGFGLGAETYIDGILARNTLNLQNYLDAKGHPEQTVAKAVRLDPLSQRARWMVAKLTGEKGISVSEFETRFGVVFDEEYGTELDKLIERGMVEITPANDCAELPGNIVRLTDIGHALANDVFSALQECPATNE